MPKITEVDIARVVIDYLEGGEIYQEVCGRGGRADIVYVCGQTVWVIEVKLSLSMSLLSQATNWVGKAHYVSIATPRRQSDKNHAAMQFLKWKGIGYLYVDAKRNRVQEVVKASLNRTARVEYLKNCLCEQQKTFAPAGNASGQYWTPYRETCRNVLSKVTRRPGVTLKELLDGLKHHYASFSSARSSIRHWADSGKIPGVEIRRDGRLLRFYPTIRKPEK